MDISKILNEKNLKAISKQSGIDADDIMKIASSVVPEIMSGMSNNAKSQSGAEALLGAMLGHADDKHDKFDLEDGAKILGHILGDKKQNANAKAAKETGIDAEDVAKIAAMIAPIILSQMGKQHKEKQKSQGADIAEIAGTLFKMFG